MLRFAWVLGALAMFAGSASAQPCYGENDDDTFEDGSSTGTAHFAVRFVPNLSLTVSRAEVFTGEVSAQQEIGIWSDDAFNDQPLISLANGFFGTVQTNSWQGATLSVPVNLVAGQVYWMVWGSTAGAQSPVLPPQTIPGQEIRVSLDSGATWGPKFSSYERHFKFRFLCDCSAAGAAYGQGCPGTGGLTPALTLNECPQAGQAVSLTISNAVGGVNALLMFGLQQTQVPIGATGCDLLIAPILPIVITIPLSGAGPGQGSATVQGVLPVNSSGVIIEFQSFILDPGGPLPGFTATNGVELKVP